MASKLFKSRRTFIAPSDIVVPTIPGFHLTENVGSGTYGDVWRGKIQSSGTTVVVKVFKQPFELGPKSVSSWKHEIAISNFLSSKANDADVPIVKTLNSYADTYTRSKSENNISIHSESSKYIVMEYCHGGSLFDLTLFGTKKLLSEAEASIVAYRVGSALAFCHSHNVIHLDVKPHNILFREKLDVFGKRRHLCSACLADFGVSEYTDKANIKYAMDCKVGSKRYMAPEINLYTAAIYTPAADSWSLGVVLLEILTGIVPPESVISDALRQSAELNDQWLDRYIAAAFLPRESKAGRNVWQQKLSNEAKDVIRRLLTPDRRRRMSVAELLCHKWLIRAKQCCCKCTTTASDHMTLTMASKFRGCFGA